MFMDFSTSSDDLTVHHELFVCFFFNNLDGVYLPYGEGEFTLLFHFKHEIKRHPVAYVDIWTSGHMFNVGQQSSKHM